MAIPDTGVARAELPAHLRADRVTAILRAPTAEDHGRIAETLVRAGVRVVELTLTTPGALEALPELRAEFGSTATIGIGTVTSVDEAKRAIEAGAEFLVTPILDVDVIAVCVSRKVPVIPGALTPTEIFQAWRAGASAVKIFPASTVGPRYLRELRGPFPELAVIPSGGVGLEDAPTWLAEGAVAVGMGGSLIGADPLNDVEGLRERVRTLLARTRVEAQ